MNNGKKFEQDFKNSVPTNVWYYRFRDGTASFYGGGDGNNIRFQQNNICDCEIFTGSKLLLCELKSHKGKSIPFNCIRENQIKQMSEAGQFGSIIPLLIINFADCERAFAVHISNFKSLMETSPKKSANITEIQEIGQEIVCTKKISHYRYGVDDLLKHWQ